jgi:hypothetical protein
VIDDAANDAVSPFRTGFAVVNAPHATTFPAVDASNRTKWVRFAPATQSAVAVGNVNVAVFVFCAGAVPDAADQSAAVVATRAYAPPDGSVTFAPASVGVVDESPRYNVAGGVHAGSVNR